MLAQALDKLGGVDYLVDCGSDPKTKPAFLGLVGKMLPMQLTGEGGGPMQVEQVTRRIVDPRGS